jgi:hypothetical protein
VANGGSGIAGLGRRQAAGLTLGVVGFFFVWRPRPGWQGRHPILTTLGYLVLLLYALDVMWEGVFH